MQLLKNFQLIVNSNALHFAIFITQIAIANFEIFWRIFLKQPENDHRGA